MLLLFLVVLTGTLLACGFLAALAASCAHILWLCILSDPDLPEDVRALLLGSYISVYQACERLENDTQPLVLDEIIGPERALARPDQARIPQDAQMM